LDVAKAIALGADIAGLAMPFLKAAVESEAALHDLTEVLIAEITTVLFCTGNTNLSELKHSNSLQGTGDR
jgi:isopentenyl-diphosphate Delta-isomerase